MTPEIRRARRIDRMNALLKPPTKAEQHTLKTLYGCTDWGTYITQVAEDAGIATSSAYVVFDMLSPTEAFDQFRIICEDIGEDPTQQVHHT